MKHLKLFESFPFEPLSGTYLPEKGDYVVLNLDEIKKENDKNDFTKFPKFNVAKVLVANRNQAYPYLVQFTDKDTMSLKATEVLRLANSEEIDEFKVREEGDKYNL